MVHLPLPLSKMDLPPQIRATHKFMLVSEYNSQFVEPFNQKLEQLEMLHNASVMKRAEFEATDFGRLLRSVHDVWELSKAEYYAAKEEAAEWQTGWGDWCWSYAEKYDRLGVGADAALGKYYEGLKRQLVASRRMGDDAARIEQVKQEAALQDQLDLREVLDLESHVHSLEMDLRKDRERAEEKRRVVEEELLARKKRVKV